MKIIVCGGRNYKNMTKIIEVLNEIHRESPISCVVNGSATGADMLSSEWAMINKIPHKLYPADWSKGRSAGPIRNLRMITDNPDVKLVVAFPGGKGTENMIKLSIKHGLTVKIVGER